MAGKQQCAECGNSLERVYKRKGPRFYRLDFWYCSECEKFALVGVVPAGEAVKSKPRSTAVTHVEPETTHVENRTQHVKPKSSAVPRKFQQRKSGGKWRPPAPADPSKPMVGLQKVKRYNMD